MNIGAMMSCSFLDHALPNSLLNFLLGLVPVVLKYDGGPRHMVQLADALRELFAESSMKADACAYSFLDITWARRWSPSQC